MTPVRFLVTFVVFAFFGGVWPLYSGTGDEIPADFRVYIYMDRVSFTDDEPVILHVRIKNNSDTRKNLKIYDEPYTTFLPVVYDESGKEAEIIVPYRLMNKKMGDILTGASPGVVELSRYETLEHSINLRDVYRLELDREYRVEVRFSRDAASVQHITGENVFTFRTYKSAGTPEHGGVLRIGRDISPAEIIMLFLHAEKSRNWDNYLKYIKLEDYIQAYPDYVSVYRKSDDIKKTIVIDEFIKFLKKRRSDYILDFKVIDEIIKEEDRAYVDAEIKRYGPRFPFVYRYRYTLERFRSFWRVTDVEATVIKGQKL